MQLMVRVLHIRTPQESCCAYAELRRAASEGREVSVQKGNDKSVAAREVLVGRKPILSMH